jgi:DNA-binding IclR family transcriptional regulator
MRTVAVKSAARILDVLELLAGLPHGLRLNQLARSLGIPKSSASALLATLEGRGYVECAGDGYRLAPGYRESGWVGGMTGALVRASRPAMERLVEITGESAFLGVATAELDIRYVAKVVSGNPLRYDVELTALRPAWCTSIGQVILSALEPAALDAYFAGRELVPVTPRTVTGLRAIRKALREARERGYVTIADSHVMGASGAAAPVAVQGTVVAALAVIAPNARFDAARARIVPAVVEAARDIGRALVPAVAEPAAPATRRMPARLPAAARAT